MSLSVILITCNEERNISQCLASVAWANEIIVVDSRSTDRTVELARTFTPHVYIEEFKGYSENKNSALRRASSEWILWIDADERSGIGCGLQRRGRGVDRQEQEQHHTGDEDWRQGARPGTVRRPGRVLMRHRDLPRLQSMSGIRVNSVVFE